ncbi:hypothetical protein KSD_13530 [Ktedonobacter sp. SOSP1-85]|uniref:YbjN domain-containing protein n=1 Tax=Ktedonobacter sp. SOSP1-85 TaxID=2778367 RepID=UPI001915E282|nr:YbjN domain-containing protein [Ktedonobacter sp. SOSP1-85]GHO73582.1 hypothetical protein KSD_13530 [Ktedonobacter sp. SOSP1-85]
MSHSFGIPQLIDYLNRMGLKITRIDEQQELLEMIFHGEHGQWRLIVGLQRRDDLRKLMLVVPHFMRVSQRKRLECLEALMAVNYRIAIGKFGMDLEDGEVRLEETIPLATHYLSFEQFQLAVGAIMQTVGIYHSLFPRIIQQNQPILEAIQGCEREFFQSSQESTDTEQYASQQTTTEELPDLNVEDILAEVTRILESQGK